MSFSYLSKFEDTSSSSVSTQLNSYISLDLNISVLANSAQSCKGQTKHCL